MNKLDWIILILILVSTSIGIFRGFIKEFLKLINLGLAIYGAIHLQEYLNPMLHLIKSEEIRAIISYILIFVFIFIAGSIIIFLVCQMFDTHGIGKFFDKFLGSSYGLIRGLAIIIICVNILERNVNIVKQDWWQKSLTLVQVKKLSNIVFNFIPIEWKKKLDKL